MYIIKYLGVLLKLITDMEFYIIFVFNSKILYFTVSFEKQQDHGLFPFEISNE